MAFARHSTRPQCRSPCLGRASRTARLRRYRGRADPNRLSWMLSRRELRTAPSGSGGSCRSAMEPRPSLTLSPLPTGRMASRDRRPMAQWPAPTSTYQSPFTADAPARGSDYESTRRGLPKGWAPLGGARR
jgi:hypothetical protein